MEIMQTVVSLLRAGGFELSAGAAEKLTAYHRFLMGKNQVMDLTNVPEEEMPLRHYADSLLPLARAEWFPPHTRCIDVGSGAGFPGLMIAIARPDLHMTLLDAQRKRCDFLREAAEILALENVTVLHARAEDAARGPLRETMHAAMARAVSPLDVLLEYLLPFVQPGGLALCWKGPALQQEADQARRACSLLGGRMEDACLLPLEGQQHYVQPVLKVQKTPPRYPRRAGMPSKEPLR